MEPTCSQCGGLRHDGDCAQAGAAASIAAATSVAAPGVRIDAAARAEIRAEGNLAALREPDPSAAGAAAAVTGAATPAVGAAAPQRDMRSVLEVLGPLRQGPSSGIDLVSQRLVEEYRHPGVALPLEQQDVDVWAGLLAQAHFLLLSSMDDSVLLSAASSLRAHEQFKVRRAWTVFPQSPEWRKVRAEFTDLVEGALRPGPDRGAGQAHDGDLLIVSANAVGIDSVRELVGWMAEGLEASWLSHKQSRLKECRRALLVLTRPDIIADGLRSQVLSQLHRTISFVGPRIRRLTRDPAELRRLSERIEQAQRAGRCGPDRELCALLDRVRDAQELVSELERLEQGAARTRRDEGRAQAAAIVEDPDPIKIDLLYIAAYLPGLLIEDFELVLLILLADRVQDAPPLSTPQTPPPPPRLLRDVWSTTRAPLLRACGLRAVPDLEAAAPDEAAPSEATRCVRFDPEEMRTEVLRLMEERDPWLHQERFERILDAGLLFRGGDRLAQALVDLAVGMVRRSPDRHGPDWLLALLLSAGPPAPNAEALPLPEQVLRLIGHFQEAVRTRVFDRLRLLVRAMLQRPGLEKLVEGFFNRLIDMQCGHELLQLAFRLRNEPAFDELRWIGQILERGDEEARGLAFRELHRALRSPGPRMVRVLHRVSSWLPRHDEPVRNRCGAAALQLVVCLCQDVIVNDHTQAQPGAGSPLDPLPAVLARPEGRDLIPALIGWLFHPALAEVLAGEEALHAHVFMARVLEPLQPFLEDGGLLLLGVMQAHWQRFFSCRPAEKARAAPGVPLLLPALCMAQLVVLLLGEAPQPATGEAADLLHDLVAEIVRVGDAPSRRAIQDILSTQIDCLAEVLTALRRQGLAGDAEWRRRREALRERAKWRRERLRSLRLLLSTRPDSPGKRTGASP